MAPTIILLAIFSRTYAPFGAIPKVSIFPKDHWRGKPSFFYTISKSIKTQLMEQLTLGPQERFFFTQLLRAWIVWYILSARVKRELQLIPRTTSMYSVKRHEKRAEVLGNWRPSSWSWGFYDSLRCAIIAWWCNLYATHWPGRSHHHTTAIQNRGSQIQLLKSR